MKISKAKRKKMYYPNITRNKPENENVTCSFISSKRNFQFIKTYYALLVNYSPLLYPFQYCIRFFSYKPGMQLRFQFRFNNVKFQIASMGTGFPNSN